MNTTLNPPLDAYDTRILAELQADARLSMAELGRRVHLSQPAVTERVKKLEAAGVISGYRATVDLGRLGYGIRAIIRVGRADYARVVKLIQQTPECVNAYNVTGDDSWILEIASSTWRTSTPWSPSSASSPRRRRPSSSTPRANTSRCCRRSGKT